MSESLFLIGDCYPKLQVSLIMDHYTTIKFDIFNIFTDINIGMSIYPISFTFIFETKFFDTDGTDIDLFYFYLVVYDQGDGLFGVGG